MPGKQDPKQGSQRDTPNTGTGGSERSNVGEQSPDQQRKGQGSERGSQTGSPQQGTERTGTGTGGSQSDRDTSTQRNNPERGSQRS